MSNLKCVLHQSRFCREVDIRNITIRIASIDDAEKLLNIYATYVKNTAISFEYFVPSTAEFQNRIADTLRVYPYLVAEVDEKIVGYCYASSFHSREAYKYAVEVSIYISEEYHGVGIGRALYEKLEHLLIKQNVFVMYACVTYMSESDRYLPTDSLAFHKHMGYKRVGIHKNCGYKFDRWYSICWFEKEIAQKSEHPEAFMPVCAIN